MNDASGFWSAMAQILPVLALAVVVEARGVSRKWTRKTPRRVRLSLSLLALLSIIGATASEIAAFHYLRGGSLWDGWEDVSIAVVALALVYLVASQSTEVLVKGNAEAFATARPGIITASARNQIRPSRRRLRRAIRRSIATRTEIWEVYSRFDMHRRAFKARLEWRERALATLRATDLDPADPLIVEGDQIVAEGRAILEDLDGQVATLNRMWRRAIAVELQAPKDLATLQEEFENTLARGKSTLKDALLTGYLDEGPEEPAPLSGSG